MKPFSIRQRRVLHIATFAFLSIVSASAEDKYSKTKEPVFLVPESGHALVYFARPDFQRLIPEPTFKVFLDSTPVGWLPQRSYLAAQVEPGNRVVWGSGSDAKRFDFEAGKTYLVILYERYGSPNRTIVGSSWQSDNPEDVQFFVKEKKLSYVKANEAEMGKLREEAAKKYEKQEQRAPEVHAEALPATFEKVWYRTAKRGFAWKAYDATGTLTVKSDTIEYKSDKENITIPIKDVQSLALDRFTGFVNSGDETQWGMVKFTGTGGEEVAAFRAQHDAVTNGDTERIFLTLQSAVKISPASMSPEQTASATQPASSLPDGAPSPPTQPAASAAPVGDEKPALKTGEIDEKQSYKSQSGMFTVVVPTARNPFVRTYKFGEADLKQGTADYAEVVFHIDDLGQTYGAGVHRIPQSVLAQMAKDGEKQTSPTLPTRPFSTGATTMRKNLSRRRKQQFRRSSAKACSGVRGETFFHAG